MLKKMLVASAVGFFALAAAPVAAPAVGLDGWSAEAAPSYKAKRYGHKKRYAKRGKAMHYQYNAPGSRFPGSWRY
jgi:hypothetical protein